MKSHETVLYDTTNHTERYDEARNFLFATRADEFDWKTDNDVPEKMIYDEMSFMQSLDYQYFQDKTDLFSYLVRPLQPHFFDLARDEVEKAAGDLSRAPLAIYDRFFGSDDVLSQNLTRCIRVIRCNPDSEFHTLFCSPDSPITSIVDLVDTRFLAGQDPLYIREVFGLFVFVIASAIIDTLNRPDQREIIRNQLDIRVGILLRGCAAPEGGSL